MGDRDLNSEALATALHRESKTSNHRANPVSSTPGAKASSDQGGITFRILGPLEIEVDGQASQIQRPLERALLAFFLFRAREVVPSEEIVDQLWPGHPTESARHSLHVHVCRLRSELGRSVLFTQRPGYVLRVDAQQIDSNRFQERVQAGRTALREGRLEQGRLILREALAMWRGRPLPELLDVIDVKPEVSRLEELMFGAFEDLHSAELLLGNNADVVEQLTSVVSRQPFRERLWGHLILALYRSGRRAEALLAYRDLTRVLDEELGIDPCPDLQRLHDSIIRESDEVDWLSGSAQSDSP